MDNLELLKAEIKTRDYVDYSRIEDYYRYQGYMKHYQDDPLIAKAHAIASLFTQHEKYIYDNDLVAGSLRGCYTNSHNKDELAYAEKIAKNYGKNSFATNLDHDVVDYEMALQIGVGGIIEKIKMSQKMHVEKDKLLFLESALITMTAFSQMIKDYGDAAEEKGKITNNENHFEIARICRKLAWEKPESFHEALQLVWLIHMSFLYEGRYAMGLGRLDQYLYPFFVKDTISPGRATKLLACTLYKIGERRHFTGGVLDFGNDDVVNIVIGGVTRGGLDAVNELTYLILDAVKECQIPGPNLSARVSIKNPDKFIDKCLEVIGTGIGYPALMNDEVNISALARYGYDIEDCRDYCMVGCIENFIGGKQPPWSDGRYNSPKYLELALNNGRCMLTGTQMGPETGVASDFESMEMLMAAVEKQMAHGAAEYIRTFNNENSRYNKWLYGQPYLSCYHDDCIRRGLDVMNGGSIYPSVHGAGCMGIGTMSDSLAAIEKMVYENEELSLTQLCDILINNFEGHDDVHQKLLQAPKYGNNDDYVDKYAKWFVDVHYELFSKLRTFDGGGVYVAIASNIDNIRAGFEIAASADGRGCRQPLSNAASPSHGLDVNGITASLLSCAKPDYTKAACGTVVNVKFDSGVLHKKNFAKVRALVKVYFACGGQEMQINCVSREKLMEASTNPELYKNLVVRVSGFSAYYIDLSKEVQKDILERIEHGY